MRLFGVMMGQSGASPQLGQDVIKVLPGEAEVATSGDSFNPLRRRGCIRIPNNLTHTTPTSPVQLTIRGPSMEVQFHSQYSPEIRMSCTTSSFNVPNDFMPSMVGYVRFCVGIFVPGMPWSVQGAPPPPRQGAHVDHRKRIPTEAWM